MEATQSDIKKSNKSSSKNSKKNSTNQNKFILIVNAQESVEISMYRVKLDSAPNHMKRVIRRSSTKVFRSLMRDGPDSMDYLVDPDDEEADEKADEIMDWLEDQCTPTLENKYEYPFPHVDACVSLAGGL